MICSVYVSLFGKQISCKIVHSVYVQLRCTDSDWDGTVVEQTVNHLFFQMLIYNIKGCYMYN